MRRRAPTPRRAATRPVRRRGRRRGHALLLQLGRLRKPGDLQALPAGHGREGQEGLLRLERGPPGEAAGGRARLRPRRAHRLHGGDHGRRALWRRSTTRSCRCDENVDDKFKNLPYDPENRWSVPKDWGTTGYTYRTDLIEERPTTWREFVDLTKGPYSGKVTILDAIPECIGSIAVMLGYSYNTEDEGELDEVQAGAAGPEAAPPRDHVDREPAAAAKGHCGHGHDWNGDGAADRDTKGTPSTSSLRRAASSGSTPTRSRGGVRTRPPRTRGSTTPSSRRTIRSKSSTTYYGAVEEGPPRRRHGKDVLDERRHLPAGRDRCEARGRRSRRPRATDPRPDLDGVQGRIALGCCGRTAQTAPAREDSRRRRRASLSRLARAPGAGLVRGLLPGPGRDHGRCSLAERSGFVDFIYAFNTDNFTRLSDPLYRGIFVDTLKMALFGTVVALLIGFPLSYYLARYAKRKTLLLLLIVVPFWTSFLIRTYAWLIILDPAFPAVRALNRSGSSARTSTSSSRPRPPTSASSTPTCR